MGVFDKPSIKANFQQFTDDMRLRSDVALRQMVEMKTAVIIGTVALVIIALVVIFK